MDEITIKMGKDEATILERILLKVDEVRGEKENMSFLSEDPKDHTIGEAEQLVIEDVVTKIQRGRKPPTRERVALVIEVDEDQVGMLFDHAQGYEGVRIRQVNMKIREDLQEDAERAGLDDDWSQIGGMEILEAVSTYDLWDTQNRVG